MTTNLNCQERERFTTYTQNISLISLKKKMQDFNSVDRTDVIRLGMITIWKLNIYISLKKLSSEDTEHSLAMQ